MGTQAWASLPPTGPLLRPKQAAAYLGIAVSTFYERAAAGALPKPIRLDGAVKIAGVPRPWLDAIIAQAVTV